MNDAQGSLNPSLLYKAIRDTETGEVFRINCLFRDCVYEDRPDEKFTCCSARSRDGVRSRLISEMEIGEGKRYEIVGE